MLMIYLHTKLQLLIFSGSFVIVNNPKCKHKLNDTTMLLFISNCKIYINNKSTLNDASVTPTSQIATIAMLLLHVAEH